MSAELIHPFDLPDIEKYGVGLPLCLNDPFDYVPHPLCRRAADAVFAHLASHPEWSDELEAGKMFGVLAVRDSNGRTGFLAAFSGNLDGSNNHPYFVPPIYDMLQPDGFFRREEAAISAINRRIADLESSAERLSAIDGLRQAERSAELRLTAFRAAAVAAKRVRDERRAATSDPQILEELDNESRREKSELRRLKAMCAESVNAAKERVEIVESGIKGLKEERRHRSEQLQRRLFDSFVIASADGERSTLTDIFAAAEQTLPPAGAGECAAPKLLQYAFLNGLTPLSIAEFWYGRSPKGEVRRHGSFYPACRGKCRPILAFMLRGVQLERRPKKDMTAEPEIIFEDDAVVVVVKPAGMLSVEGKVDIPSVEGWAARRYEGVCETKIVHRLDMDVSGLLLIAKGLQSYRNLQEQFLRRTVGKRYVALLEGCIGQYEGEIDLPLRPDPDDRPRQMVDHRHGKRALTRFRVRERRHGFTLAEFEPVTGRTHQLRVHAASVEGLNAPISGDTLYGAQPAARLYLHNEFIGFDHPVTGERLEFTSPPPPEDAF